MKTIINSRNIFYPFLALLFGITVARKFFGGSIDVIIITLLILLTMSVCLIINKKIKFLSILLLLFIFGNGLYFIGVKIWTPKEYVGQVSVVGRVKDGVTDENYNTFTVILDDVKINGKSGKNIKLTLRNCEETPHAGEIFAFEGELKPIKLYELGKFNSYDFRKNVRYSGEIYWKDVVSITEGKLKFDESVRLKIRDIIYSNMSEKNAGLAFAVLFGDSAGVDNQTRSAYKDAGIIHVLTVSGLHIGFLIGLLFWILKLLKVNKYVRFSITTIFVIFYSYLCGWTPAVLRAGIMAIILMVAGLLGKRYDGLNSLGLAGFIICLTRPLISQDIGFLMSFFSVMAIYMLSNIIRNLLNKIFPRQISSLIAVSVSAQIGVIPFLATFGTNVNLLSFVINLIVIPIFGIIYPLLFSITFISLILPFMGKLLVLVDLLFKAVNGIVAFFGWANLSIMISSAAFGVIVLVFLVIFAISGYVMVEDIRKFTIFSLVSVVAATLLGCYSLPQKNSPKIAFINSNSQYSLIVTTVDGENVVIGNNSLLENYKIEYRPGKYSLFVSPTGRLSRGEIEQLSLLGIKKFISFSSQSDSDKVKKVEKNKVIEIITEGDKVSIAYLEHDNQYLGMELNFCNKTIFLANENIFSYNLVRTFCFSEKQPDIIITNYEDDYSSSEAIVISNSPDIRGDYNYQRDGNLMLTFKEDKILVRGID